MSKIYDMFLQYAKTVLGNDIDDKVRSGISDYLLDHGISDIDDEVDAEFEMIMFKQMSPTIFKAYFSNYSERALIEHLSEQAIEYATERAINGITISQPQLKPLLKKLLTVSASLSADKENNRWLKMKLDDALINFKYAAGLSTEVSEEVVKRLRGIQLMEEKDEC